jgi:hypothetical protein
LNESTLPSSEPGTQKRRSTRIVQAIPITVSGVDALGQPFKERTTTVMVNCHGCKYQSKHYVPKNSVVTIEIPRAEPAFPARVVPGHVVWVQRPRTVRELFQIGLEFEAAGNVWGIAFPPEDWVPSGDEESAATKAPSEIEVVVETKPAAPVAPKPVAPVAQGPEKTSQPLGPIPPPAGRAATTPAAPSASASAVKAAPTPAPLTPNPVPPAPTTAVPPPPPPAPPSASPPAADAKIHVMPSPAAGTQDAQLVIARQMAKVVAEAKETLDKTLRRGAQSAINEEMTIVRQQMDAQMHETVEHAIKSSMERVSEAEVKKVILQAANKTAAIVEEARLASLAGVQQNVQQIEAKVREAVQKAVSEAAASQTAALAEEARRAAQQAASQASEEAAARSKALLEEVQKSSDANKQIIEEGVRRSAQEAAAQAARQVQETVAKDLKRNVEEAVGRAIAEREANVPSLQVLASPEAAQQHIEEWKKNLEQTAQGVHGQMVAQTEAEAEAASRRWHEELEAMLSGSSQKLGERLSEVSQAALAETELGIAERTAGLHDLIAEVVSGAESAVLSLGTELAQQRALAENAKAQLQESAKATVERTRQQMDQLVAAQKDVIARRADEVIAERVRHIEPALQVSAQKVMQHFSEELDQEIAPRLERVQQAVSEVSNATDRAAELRDTLRGQMEQTASQAAQIQHSIQERVQAASDTAVKNAVAELAFAGQEALRLQEAVREEIRNASQKTVQETIEQMKQETARFPGELEQTCRATIGKLEEELDQKSSEMQHSAYEALLKSSEWYQKKAQTAMNATMERVTEQSANTMREKAAEVSSMVASELDHYRRSYVEHSRAEIEEAGKEVTERERTELNETAEIANATFHDRVQHVTLESLRRFQESSREALEKARSDMEFNRESSLEDFQKALDQKMTQGVEQASTYLQAQLVPLLQSWEAEREAEKRQWMVELKKSSEDSMDAYKERLENATNAWLLASAAKLGQNSQAVLDSLAKTAEKRMRDTCSQVLAGMGDVLKDKLLGISTTLAAEEESESNNK